MIVIQNELVKDAPVFARNDCAGGSGVGVGLGVGVGVKSGVGLGSGVDGVGSGVGAGVGVTLGSGLGSGVGAGVGVTLGSGLGAGSGVGVGAGGTHSVIEGLHSMQPLPSHEIVRLVARDDDPPKRVITPITPRRVASRATLSGVLFLGSAVVMFPLSLVGIADCKSSLSSRAGKRNSHISICWTLIF